MNESCLIVLPLPSGVLSPNHVSGSFGGRVAKWKATSHCKRVAKEAAQAQMIASAPWKKATIKATFYHKQERRRDDVNAYAACKAYWDGIVDAGLLVDDDHTHLTTLPASFAIDKKFPRVELLIERIL